MVGREFPGYSTFKIESDVKYSHRIDINFPHSTSLTLYADQDYSSKFLSSVKVDFNNEPSQYIDIETYDMSLTVIELEKQPSG